MRSRSAMMMSMSRAHLQQIGPHKSPQSSRRNGNIGKQVRVCMRLMHKRCSRRVASQHGVSESRTRETLFELKVSRRRKAGKVKKAKARPFSIDNGDHKRENLRRTRSSLSMLPSPLEIKIHRQLPKPTRLVSGRKIQELC